MGRSGIRFIAKVRLENAAAPWDDPMMQLKTDNRCRLTSRDLLKPNTSYEAEKTPDGAIRLVELVPKTTPKAKLVRKNGRLLVDIGRPFDAEELKRALEDYL